MCETTTPNRPKIKTHDPIWMWDTQCMILMAASRFFILDFSYSNVFFCRKCYVVWVISICLTGDAARASCEFSLCCTLFLCRMCVRGKVDRSKSISRRGRHAAEHEIASNETIPGIGHNKCKMSVARRMHRICQSENVQDSHQNVFGVFFLFCYCSCIGMVVCSASVYSLCMCLCVLVIGVTVCNVYVRVCACVFDAFLNAVWSHTIVTLVNKLRTHRNMHIEEHSIVCLKDTK